MTKNKSYKIISNKTSGSEATIEVSVDHNFVNGFRTKAIKNLGKEVEIKGFRKGMAPENMLVQTIGEMRIFEEQSYQALYEILPTILIEEKIDALTHPKISITKISPGNDLEFKAEITLMPKIELVDYKKIAKSIKSSEAEKVTEKEITDYIDYIRKNRAEANFVKRKTAGEKVEDSEKNNLPELNDEFVKTLGKFENVEDFKKQLAENMQTEKNARARDQRRIMIIEKIIDESKIEIPDVLVDEEKNRMVHQYQHDVEHLGIKFEDYLKEIKKTEDDLKKEWHADAVKRAKMNLVLPKIAQAEKITPDQKRIDAEVQHIIDHHKDINPESAKIYITHTLTNEKVFEFLENIK